MSENNVDEYVGICSRCLDPLKKGDIGAHIRGDLVEYREGNWVHGVEIFFCHQCNEDHKETAKGGIRAAVLRKLNRQTETASLNAVTSPGGST